MVDQARPRNSVAVPELSVIAENETREDQAGFDIDRDRASRTDDGVKVATLLPSAASMGLMTSGMTRTQSTSALRMLKKRIRQNHAFTFIDRFQDSRHSDDAIVTPFAQIVHSLRSVRTNLVSLTKSSAPLKTNKTGCLGCDKEKIQSKEALNGLEYEKLSADTLEELEWCLEQLEIIQTHRSVSEMATNKFKRILNRELSHFAGSSKAGNQISEYISSTFLDKQEDIYRDEAFSASDSSRLRYLLQQEQQQQQQQQQQAGHGDQRDETKSQRKSPMLEITGVKRPSITPPSSSQNLPKYGIESNDPQRLDQIMTGLDKWGIDIFEISSLTNSRPLTAVTYTIIVKRNLLKAFAIPEVTMLNYLMTAEDHYRPSVPYHNSLHAADVTQSAHSLLGLAALENLFSDLELLATIFACAIHDIDHPGFTNNYFITTGSDLALMYNDESVLENHHLAVGFKLLQQKDCDFLANLPAKSRQLLRRIVISIVLATDMNKHMDHVAHLKTMVEARKLSGTDILNTENHSDRLLVLQHLVHCADLSNPTKPLNLYRKWTDRIMEEFFRQGDSERSQNLDISPMCDRHTATVEKSQVGFIDYIAHPLWDTWAELVEPGCKDILENLESNREWYHNAGICAVEGKSSLVREEDEEEDEEEEEDDEYYVDVCDGKEEDGKDGKQKKTMTTTMMTDKKQEKLKESSVDGQEGDKPLCFFILGEEEKSKEPLPHEMGLEDSQKRKTTTTMTMSMTAKKIVVAEPPKNQVLPSIVLDTSGVD